MASIFELLGGGSPTSILDSTANLAANKLAGSFPVSSNPPANAFSYLDMNQPNTGITGAKMNLEEEEEFKPGTMYTTNPESSFANASLIPNSSAPGFDNRFSGIMRNTVARPLMFQGGAQAGLGIGQLLTGAANPLFALAGAVGSQFLPLNNRPSDIDYNYINNKNMGGLSLRGNKIQDPTGILQGKNFASGFGSNSLADMYDKALDKNEGYLESLGGIGDLTEEELAALGLTTKELARRNTLLERRGIINNRRQDFIMGGEMIPGTGKTRAQFADEYKTAQENIGSNYDQLDTQSYTGSTASGGLGGGEQADGSYNDPYDPGTDD